MEGRDGGDQDMEEGEASDRGLLLRWLESLVVSFFVCGLS